MIEGVGIYLIIFPSLLCCCNKLQKKIYSVFLSFLSFFSISRVNSDITLTTTNSVYNIDRNGRRGDDIRTRSKKESGSHPQRENFSMKGNRDQKKKIFR